MDTRSIDRIHEERPASQNSTSLYQCDSGTEVSEDEDSFQDYGTVTRAFRDIQTDVKCAPADLRAVRRALCNGDIEAGRPALPEGIVTKILQLAEYWCCVEKNCLTSFQAYDIDFRFFKFGPIPGTPRRVDIQIVSRDQGSSSYEDHIGTKYNSWTWGEVDVKDPSGKSKLLSRQVIFINLHAVGRCQTRSFTFGKDDAFMAHLSQGDTLEFYFRAQFPWWCIFVKSAKMTLFFEAP